LLSGKNPHPVAGGPGFRLLADSSELRDILKGYPDYKLVIEGHCDERGSAEFSFALGDKRAEAAKEYLVQIGIPSGQLGLVSYGKEKPVCQEHDETCWQRNRRITLSLNCFPRPSGGRESQSVSVVSMSRWIEDRGVLAP
jgi:hypothetical protein